jgi:serine protease AprX
MYGRRLLGTMVLSGLATLIGAAGAVSPPPLSYIVNFDAPPTSAQLETLASIATGVHGYTRLPMAAVVIPPGSLGLLRNLPGVKGIYPNTVLKYTLNGSTRTIHADGVWADGYTGEGVGIAVIDAGIDGTHPDLCARAEFCNGTPVKTVQNVKILGNQSYLDPVVVLEDQISTDWTSGHGSHVAGIAAGFGTASQEPSKYRGVAPGAKLIGLGTGEVLEVVTVLAAFDWVLAHKDDPAYNIKVVNNSWGPGAYTPFDPNDPVQRAITAAYDAGLSVVFGAGNEGPRTGTINAFSANPKAISAAGGSKVGHMAVFSGRGVPGSSLWKPTVTTPGMFIASVRARTGFYGDVADLTGPDPANPILPPDDLSYAYASGTSMSSPHVAGVVALMQEAAHSQLGRYLSPAEVRNVLQNTAVSRDSSRGPGGLPNYQSYSMGAGYVDALAAVRAVAAGTGLQPYNSGTVDDVRAFTGTVGASTLLTPAGFESTFVVYPGAISLDVMADWPGDGAAAPYALQDIDVDLYNPAGALVLSTTLRCDAAEGPNQMSSFCTTAPNERINVVAPMAGTWRAMVKGAVSVSQAVYGMWSAVYPAGATLPAAPAAASITIAAPAAPSQTLAAQPAQLVAVVRDAAGNPLANAPVSWSTSGVGSLMFAETLTDERGTAVASALSSSPGTQTVTASSGASSGNAAVSWLGVALPALPLGQSTPGKASGGGNFNNPNKRKFSFFGEYALNGAQSASGSQYALISSPEYALISSPEYALIFNPQYALIGSSEYALISSPEYALISGGGSTLPTLTGSAPGGELFFDDKAGTVVRSSSVDSFAITSNRAIIKGPATLNGTAGYKYQLDVTDNGEPGSSDTFKLVVTKPLSPLWRYETSGTLSGGNIKVTAY